MRALVALALAVGIAGLTAGLSSYAILTRELNRGYLETNPASAILRLDALDEAALQAVRAVPGVVAAEPRRALSGRIKAGPLQWRTLVLFVVPDFAAIRVSKLMPQAGAWPPGPGEILVERDALQVARAKIGDEVTVRTARGEDRTLRLSGTVKDVGQAQARMENLVYGYVTPRTLSLLGEEPVLDRLYLQIDGEPGAVADQVKAVLAERGHAVTRVDLPEPGKHPHADLMGLLLLVLASFALFALVLSGALVMNLMTALMASQVRQIGVMKAIGGSRAQIARIYLGQALLLGAVAVLIGIGPGLLGARAIVKAMAVFLNFDIGSFAVPVWVFAVAALLGLLAPLLSAARPVWKGTAVPVCEALSSQGVTSSHFGADAFDRALMGVGGLARPVLLSLRNAFRKRTRVLLTLGTLSLGGLFFMTALNVRASMIGTLDNLFAKMKFDLSVSLSAMGSTEQVERAVRAVPSITGFEAWLATEGSIPKAGEVSSGMHGGAAPGGGFPVFALPPATRMLDLDISRGRGLQPGDTDALVVSSALAAKYRELQPGRKVTLRMGPVVKEWQVVGVARQPFSPPAAYISRDSVGHEGSTNSLRLVVSGDVEAARAALDRALEAEGLRAMASNTKADSRTGFDEHMRMIYVALVILSSILAAVGGLGLATTMSLNVLERRRELGVLRALGATPAVVWLLVVAEGIVIGLSSWAVAALLAWPVSRFVGRGLVMHAFRSSMDFTFEPRGIGIWLGLSLLLAVLGSFVPAARATRDTIREALAYE